jgi:hypothetical protein
VAICWSSFLALLVALLSDLQRYLPRVWQQLLQFCSESEVCGDEAQAALQQLVARQVAAVQQRATVLSGAGQQDRAKLQQMFAHHAKELAAVEQMQAQQRLEAEQQRAAHRQVAARQRLAAEQLLATQQRLAVRQQGEALMTHAVLVLCSAGVVLQL